MEELLSGWPIAQNWMFVIFLFCFLININILSKREKLITTMFRNLFRNRERESIFTQPVNNEFISKILLSFQFLLLLSISSYYVQMHEKGLFLVSTWDIFSYIGIQTGYLIVFTLIKFLLNYLIGSIFFPQEQVKLWNESFFSMLSLSGLILFIPVLILFYIEEAYFFCYYSIISYTFFLVFLTIYKIYEIFFSSKRLLLYFILYLCAVEITPLFLAYKAYFNFFISM